MADISLEAFRSVAGANDIGGNAGVSRSQNVSINGHEVGVVRGRGNAVATREALLNALKNEFDGMIPERVLRAMNVSKACSGFSIGDNHSVKASNHPLSLRRLQTILQAVDYENSMRNGEDWHVVDDKERAELAEGVIGECEDKLDKMALRKREYFLRSVATIEKETELKFTLADRRAAVDLISHESHVPAVGDGGANIREEHADRCRRHVGELMKGDSFGASGDTLRRLALMMYANPGFKPETARMALRMLKGLRENDIASVFRDGTVSQKMAAFSTIVGRLYKDNRDELDELLRNGSKLTSAVAPDAKKDAMRILVRCLCVEVPEIADFVNRVTYDDLVSAMVDWGVREREAEGSVDKDSFFIQDMRRKYTAKGVEFEMQNLSPEDRDEVQAADLRSQEHSAAFRGFATLVELISIRFGSNVPMDDPRLEPYGEYISFT